MGAHCQMYDLGVIEYGEAFDLQKKAVRKMLAGELANTVLLLEHAPVYTIGRAGGEHNVLINAEQRAEL
ncbi:MAG: lipoyl(octanoyl) transferase LipB, partial [Tumebacillaceae bacterium]